MATVMFYQIPVIFYNLNRIVHSLHNMYINDNAGFYKQFKIKGNRNKNLIIEQFIQYLKRSFS